VAVREGNDILGIQACYGSVTPIRYLRDPKTPEEKAEITQLPDGSYKVGQLLYIYIFIYLFIYHTVKKVKR